MALRVENCSMEPAAVAARGARDRPASARGRIVFVPPPGSPQAHKPKTAAASHADARLFFIGLYSRST
jgi:hypothetical protein